MKVTYDDLANALYIYFDSDLNIGMVHTTYNIGHGVNLDVDKQYNAIGLEVLLSPSPHPQVVESLNNLHKEAIKQRRHYTCHACSTSVATILDTAYIDLQLCGGCYNKVKPQIGTIRKKLDI